jgi:hypothetical protein
MYAFHMHIKQFLLTTPPVALDIRTGLKTERWLASQQWCYMLWGSVSFSKGSQHHSWLSQPCMALPGFGHNQEIYGVSPGQNCAKVLGTVEEVHERQQLHTHTHRCRESLI